MKRLLSTAVIILCGLRAMAQLGDLTVTAEKEYVRGQDMVVSGSFTPNDPSLPAVQHTWELFLCDEDENPVGDAVLSEVLPGEPADYTFTNTGSLEAGRLYKLVLTVTNAHNQ